MRLDKLLAAGHSFAGMRDEKSPYVMKQENLLPVFASAPRFAKRTANENRPGPAQGELLPAGESADGARQHATGPAVRSSAPASLLGSPALGVQPRRRKMNWLSILTFGLFGRAKTSADLVQSELSLDNVRVLRNDLSDSDLELIIRRKRAAKPAAQPASPPQPPRAPAVPPRTGTWNELTAKLFEIGQH